MQCFKEMLANLYQEHVLHGQSLQIHVQTPNCTWSHIHGPCLNFLLQYVWTYLSLLLATTIKVLSGVTHSYVEECFSLLASKHLDKRAGGLIPDVESVLTMRASHNKLTVTGKHTLLPLSSTKKNTTAELPQLSKNT